MEAFIYLFGFLTLVSACGVVFSRKSLHSALSLVTTLFLVAVHFALLGADFLAALQIMIYAGAIMILVVFVIMLMGLDKDVDRKSLGLPGYFALCLSGFFGVLIAYVVGNRAIFSIAEKQVRTQVYNASPNGVGALLFSEYVYAFEVTGVLLLAAIIGAVVLAHDRRRPLAENRGLRAMHKNSLAGGRDA